MNKFSLAVLAALTVASCAKTESGEGPVSGNEIRLSAGVVSTSVTKAVINTNDRFTAGIAGWESKDAADYSQAATWTTTTSEITASKDAQTITLTDNQVYHADGGVKTYMKAWYPAGTVASGKVTFTTPSDGTADVLLASVSGSKSDRENKTLAFGHMTTQLKFVVKEGDGLAADTKIVSIKVKDAELPTGIDLTTDELICAAAADLTVPGIDGNTVIGTTSEGDAVGNPVMIKPIKGSNKVKLDVTTSTANFPDVEAMIDNDTDFVTGKAYTITLTFSQSNIELKASVAEWTSGTGSGKVE